MDHTRMNRVHRRHAIGAVGNYLAGTPRCASVTSGGYWWLLRWLMQRRVGKDLYRIALHVSSRFGGLSTDVVGHDRLVKTFQQKATKRLS